MADATTPKQRPQVNVAAFLEGEFGARIKERDGDSLLVDIDGKEERISLNKLLQGEQIDPASVDLRFGNAEKPLDDNALSFADQVAFVHAGNKRSQENYLKNKFDEVKANDDGTYNVRVGDTWKRAEPGILSELAESAPVIAAGAVGAAKGAAAGFLSPIPGGALIGAAVGGGLASAAAKGLSIANAKRIGIRGEDDAKDLAVELGKEFVLGAAGELGGRVIGAGVSRLAANPPWRVYRSAMAKNAQKLTTDAAKRDFAEVTAQLTGTDLFDQLTYLRNPKAVGQMQESYLKWQGKLASSVEAVEDPISARGRRLVQKVTTSVKNKMQREWSDAMAPFSDDIARTKVDIAPVAADLNSSLQGLGLVSETGEWMGADAAISRFVNVGRLKDSHAMITRASQAGKPLAYKDAQTLIRNVDDMMEAAGYFAQSGSEMSTAAKRQLTQLRTNLRNVADGALAATNPKAAQISQMARSKYARQSDWLDDIAVATRDNKIDAFISRVVDLKNGGRNAGMLKELTSDVLGPKTGEAVLDRLLAGRAAKNTAKMFQKDLQASKMIDRAIAAPAAYAAAGYRAGGFSGAAAGAAMGIKNAATMGPASMSRINAQQIAELNLAGQAVDFVTKLPPNQRNLLLKNPSALKSIFGIAGQAAAQIKDGKQQLLNSAGIEDDGN